MSNIETNKKFTKKQNTVFIFGSGASKTFGFPLLSKLINENLMLLWKEICLSVKYEDKELISNEEKEKIIFNLIKKMMVFLNNKEKKLIFITELYNIIFVLGKKNVINFAEINYNKQLLKWTPPFHLPYNKWFIIIEILKKLKEVFENDKKNEITVDEIALKFLNAKEVRNWRNVYSCYFNYFVKQIIEDIDLESKESINWKNCWYKNILKSFEYQNTIFINFNYDNSFLYFLNSKNLINKIIVRLISIHGSVSSNIHNYGGIYPINQFEELKGEFLWKEFIVNNTWRLPNLSYNCFNKERNFVHKVIFIGFGFHKTNLKGLFLLDENEINSYDNKINTNGKILKDINFNVVVVAGKDFDDADNKAKDRIKDLFSEFDNEFVEKINSNEEIIETKKVLLIKKNCEDLDASDWAKIESF